MSENKQPTKGGVKASTKSNTAVEPKVDIEANLDKMVNVRNLADWDVGFVRRHDSVGSDVQITKHSTQRLSRNEIIAQINNGNRLFIGIDGKGSHATIYIEDAATRKYVGFDTDEKAQQFFSDDAVSELFNLSLNEFKESIPNYIVTRAEKHALMEAIERLGFNDYRKITFACEYTGIKL